MATLADVGVNLNFAPVVDLNVNPKNPAIGALGRAFSADPAVVARDAAIEIQAHRARGVRTALKHFPGLGSATTNTDFGVADVTSTWTTTGAGPVPDAARTRASSTWSWPATWSTARSIPTRPPRCAGATVTDLLRDELGWDGVVITDDLQAGAITEAFGAEDAIALALDAGNDLLLFANQQVYDPDVVTRTIDLIEGFVTDGRIAEARIDRSVRARRPPSSTPDASRLTPSEAASYYC